jgi:hypothetical protein
MQQVSPHGDKYIYTTHAYLLSLFLDCPPGMGLHCPGPFTKEKVLQGIKSGGGYNSCHCVITNPQQPPMLAFWSYGKHDLNQKKAWLDAIQY